MPSTLLPNVAGSWYPEDTGSLRSLVRSLLDAAPAPGPGAGPVLGLIEPHAGFVYSGGVAAAGFRLVRGGRYRRVLLLGPSHYAHIHGGVVPEAETWETPLGVIPVDREAVERLSGSLDIRVDDGPFGREHSLEAELPFLQETLDPDWAVVPMLLGADISDAVATRIAGLLEPLTGPETLTVASSDFTHFGRSFGYVPFREDVPERLEELDLGAVRIIERMDVEAFAEYVDRTGATICGRHAIDLLLRLMPDGAEASLVNYDTSGRMTGDWNHTVSYAAIAFRHGIGE